jgi:hypothetical protein
MAYSIRTRYHLQQAGINQESEYIKQIYMKNKHWNMPPTPIHIKITELEQKLKTMQQRLVIKTQRMNLCNSTFSQLHTMQLLKTNKSIIIKHTDKNLGPAIMDTDIYIKQVLTEDLLTEDYHLLKAIAAKNKMDGLKRYIKKLISDNKQVLSKPELTFF